MQISSISRHCSNVYTTLLDMHKGNYPVTMFSSKELKLISWNMNSMVCTVSFKCIISPQKTWEEEAFKWICSVCNVDYEN